MKSLKTCAAVLAALSLCGVAQAGRGTRCDASKCDDCAPTFQPSCCRPTIVRPCQNVYTYQRQLSCLKPPCCDEGCGPRRGCRRCGDGCGNGCGNGLCGKRGRGNGACGNGACCNTGAGSNGACCPNGACGNGNGAGACCPNGVGDPGCAAPCGADCNACGGAGCDACGGCSGEACTIAKLIYESQTACYAKCRRNAIRQLNKYDCVCHPEIMSAFVYGLNDADERVRAASADAIGDQVRRNPSCCSSCVINALTRALADCDKTVRREAEKALCACGYDVVEPVCEVACATPACDAYGNGGCGNGANGCLNACAPAAMAPAPAAPVEEAAPAPAEEAPAPEAAPAPAPEAAAPSAYYKPAPRHTKARPTSARKSLKQMFGLAN